MSPARQFIMVVCLSAVTALAIAFAAYRERIVRNELAAIASERSDWSSKLTAAQAEREAATARSGDLENALKGCEKTRAELASKLESLSKEMQAAKPDPAVLQSVEALGKELRAAQTQAATETQTAVSALGTKVDQAIQGLQPILQSVQKVSELETQTAQKLAALESALGGLSKLAESTSQIVPKLGELETKISGAVAAAKEETAKQLGGQAALVEKNASALAALSKVLDALAQEATAQNSARKAEADSAKRELEAIRAELAKVRASLQELALAVASRPGEPATDRAPLPPNTAVRTASGAAVVIEAGEKHGVESGELLYVTRSGKPIAAVQVVNVYATLSGARIVELVRGESVRPGDTVSRSRPAAWAALDREAPQEAPAPSVPPPPPAPKP